jgi:putative transposase
MNFNSEQLPTYNYLFPVLRNKTTPDSEHYHSGIGFLTPEDVHYGRADQIIKERQAVLLAAYEIHPKRFKGKTPQTAALPPAVWINKPASPNIDPALH